MRARFLRRVVYFIALAACLSRLSWGLRGRSGFGRKTRQQQRLHISLEPKSPIEQTRSELRRITLSSIASTILFRSLSSKPARAIGSLHEFQNQTTVLQGLRFNVPDADADVAMFKELFIDECKVIGGKSTIDEKDLVLAFGPSLYAKPSNFYPGVSSFNQYGGHSTIKLRSVSASEGIVEIYEAGNGLQYLKVGANNARISKALDKGGKVTYAYGYVDIASPGGVPLEVVIGVARDPFMASCIRATDVSAAETFFVKELGMQRLSFPLARIPGSNFERQPPKNSICLGYSEDSMAIILQPVAKGEPPVQVGSIFDGFEIVYDDTQPIERLPPAIQRLRSEARTSEYSVTCPDGYRCYLIPFSEFKKSAVDSTQ